MDSEDYINYQHNVDSILTSDIKASIANVFESEYEDDEDLDLILSNFQQYDKLFSVLRTLKSEFDNAEYESSVFRYLNQVDFCYLIYLAMLNENNVKDGFGRTQTDLAVLTKLAYIEWKKDGKITEQNHFNKVMMVCYKKLIKDFHDEKLLSPKVFLAINLFIKSQESITYTTLQKLVDVLFVYASYYYNMITDLKLYDAKCKPGFLAFVCLYSIFSKRFDNLNTKRDIMLYVLQRLQLRLERAENLTALQQGILESNFRQLFRQTNTGEAREDMIAITHAFIKMSEPYPHSKMLVFIINQLPFKVYKKLILIAVRAARLTYHKSRQTFCYNLLESPYILEEETLEEEHAEVIKDLFRAIMWPITKREHEAFDTTICFLQKIVHFSDAGTVTALKDVYLNDDCYNYKYLLNYVYERSTGYWTTETTKLNTRYVVLFCRFYYLLEITNTNSASQFFLLIKKAHIIDLIPLIDIFVKILKQFSFKVDGPPRLILKMMGVHATSPSLHHIKFLQTLYELIFAKDSNINAHDVEGFSGIELGLELFNSRTVDINLLFKRMIEKNIIKLDDIIYMLRKQHTNVGKWNLLENIIPHYVTANASANHSVFIKYFAEYLQEDLFTNSEYYSVFITLCNWVILKATFVETEERFLNQFKNCIESNLKDHTIPSMLLLLALKTLEHIIEKTKGSKVVISTIYRNDEDKIKSCLESFINNNGHYLRLLVYHKSFNYFGNIGFVFGGHRGFEISNEMCMLFRKALGFINSFSIENEEIFECVLNCAKNVCLRNPQLLIYCNMKFQDLIKVPNAHLQRISLYALYDIAMRSTSDFEIVQSYIFEFIDSKDLTLKEYSLKLFTLLIDEDYVVPTHSQTFLIVNSLRKDHICISSSNQIGFTITRLFMKFEKFVQKYFIHILLYMNFYFDNKQYLLSHTERATLPKTRIPNDERPYIYTYFVMIIPSFPMLNLIRQIYIELVATYFDWPIGPPNNHQLLQDILFITYETFKQDNPEFTSNAESITEALRQIKLLKRTAERPYTTSSDLGDYLKLIINNLINILKNIDAMAETVSVSIFNVLLAIISWHFINIQNVIIDEKPSTVFLDNIFVIEQFYKTNLHLFRSEEPPIELSIPSSQEESDVVENFNRV